MKKHLCDCLKQVNTSHTNLDGGLSACLQSNKVVGQLKATNGHANLNNLKRRQNILEGTPRTLPARRTGDVPSPISTYTTTSAVVTSTFAHIEKEISKCKFRDFGKGI